MNEDKNFLYLVVYFDDDITMLSHGAFADMIISKIQHDRELIPMGKLTYILEIQVEFEGSKIRIHQQQYIKEILEFYGMSDCSGVIILMDPNQMLKPDKDNEEVHQTNY